MMGGFNYEFNSEVHHLGRSRPSGVGRHCQWRGSACEAIDSTFRHL